MMQKTTSNTMNAGMDFVSKYCIVAMNTAAAEPMSNPIFIGVSKVMNIIKTKVKTATPRIAR